jgi:hypothetical protein
VKAITIVCLHPQTADSKSYTWPWASPRSCIPPLLVQSEASMCLKQIQNNYYIINPVCQRTPSTFLSLGFAQYILFWRFLLVKYCKLLLPFQIPFHLLSHHRLSYIKGCIRLVFVFADTLVVGGRKVGMPLQGSREEKSWKEVIVRACVPTTAYSRQRKRP